MKTDSASIQDKFADDVRHIHGNLFKVRREAVTLARPGVSSEDGRLVYGNPRWFVNKEGKPEAKGIDKAKMEELKGSIRERGVDHPIRLRVAKDDSGNEVLEVVNGERRFRAISELCEKDVDSFDAVSGKMIAASDIYEWIECRIEVMDDATALCCALRLNETSEVIGETANINVVKVLRESGYDDQEILKATGKSISWLRETEKIIGLDEACLENLHSDKINRTVALRLAAIEDVTQRVAMLDEIKRAAEARHSEKVRQAKSKMEKAIMDHEVEEALADEAKEDGDVEQAEKHKAKSSEAKKKAKIMESELKKKPKATSRDLEKVQGRNKPLTSAKIQSLYMKPLKDLIENDGVRDEGEDLDLSCLVLLQAILEAIVGGHDDIWTVLDEHCPVVASESYEESEEDEEDSVAVEASSEDDEDSSDDEEDESEESEDDDDSYMDVNEEDSYDDEMTDDLEREFQEELRAMERDS